MTQELPFLQIETLNKNEAFQRAAEYLTGLSFKIVKLDILRPWGFFFYIDPGQTRKFIDTFYSGVDLSDADLELPMQPKLLGIAPGKRLSWQYHHRRSEIWRGIGGEFNIVLSATDEETEPRLVRQGEVIEIPQGIRHRGVGLEKWSSVAEIWQHQNGDNPSDEDDIVRVQDDFGR